MFSSALVRITQKNKPISQSSEEMKKDEMIIAIIRHAARIVKTRRQTGRAPSPPSPPLPSPPLPSPPLPLEVGPLKSS